MKIPYRVENLGSSGARMGLLLTTQPWKQWLLTKWYRANLLPTSTCFLWRHPQVEDSKQNDGHTLEVCGWQLNCESVLDYMYSPKWPGSWHVLKHVAFTLEWFPSRGLWPFSSWSGDGTEDVVMSAHEVFAASFGFGLVDFLELCFSWLKLQQRFPLFKV